MSKQREVVEEAEVVVVGAGPAGAAAAAMLGRIGREVLLIDQHEFPRDKPCGDALWFSAVRSLEILGLGELVEDAWPIEGVRVSRVDGVRTSESCINSRRGRQPRCIPRKELDLALVKSALDSGARFLHGRVHETIEREGNVSAVIVHRADGTFVEVRGKKFIAADGATSRMRRLIGSSSSIASARAYAIRQYFRTEHELDPVFDIRIPIRSGHVLLPGYAWVFPVSPHLANVGIGFYREPGAGGSKDISLRGTHARFVDTFCSFSKSNLGDIESVSEAKGAPLAVGFSTSSVQRGNVLFVGDAARLTDPLIGEGIATALRSGLVAAEEVSGSLKRGSHPKYGDRLLKDFPRVGQDANVIVRAYELFVADAGPVFDDQVRSDRNGHPLFETVIRMLTRETDETPGLESTPVCQLISSSLDPGDYMQNAFNDALLDALRTEFPFTLETLHRQVRSHSGPTRAATLFLVESAFGAAMSEHSASSGIAVELLDLAIHFFGQTSSESGSNEINLGNGLATLIADHALSVGLRAMATVGARESILLARMARTVYEGAMADADAKWDLDRSQESYLTSAGDYAGTLHAHAAGLGARQVGRGDASEALSRIGHHLGVAFKISDDTFELMRGDFSTGREPGECLRDGNFSLAVIYALEEDPEIAKWLNVDAIEASREDVIERIGATSAIRRCAAECEKHTAAALPAIAEIDLPDPSGLQALANLPVSRCQDLLVTAFEQPTS